MLCARGFCQINGRSFTQALESPNWAITFLASGERESFPRSLAVEKKSALILSAKMWKFYPNFQPSELQTIFRPYICSHPRLKQVRHSHFVFNPPHS